MSLIPCHFCHKTWDGILPLGRRDSCSHCGRDAKICLNCKFYNANVYHECEESNADFVPDKDRGNFCDYFFAAGSVSAEQENSLDNEKLRALFGSTELNDAKKKSKLEEELEAFLKKK